MAKKQGRRMQPRAATAAGPQPGAEAWDSDSFFGKNLLLDWRFNLVVLLAVEVLIILLFLNREVTYYHVQSAKQALLKAHTAQSVQKNKYLLDAMAEYKWLRDNDPTNAAYVKGIADVYLEQGQYLQAYQYYQTAMQRDPNLGDLKIQFARAVLGLLNNNLSAEQQKRAISEFESLVKGAIQENPTGLRVNFFLGQYREDAGQYAEAAEFYARVRADMIPLGLKPNAEQRMLIEEAKKAIERVQARVLQGQDYALNISGMPEIQVPQRDVTVPPPGMQTPPPAVPTPGPTPASMPTATPAPSQPATDSALVVQPTTDSAPVVQQTTDTAPVVQPTTDSAPVVQQTTDSAPVVQPTTGTASVLQPTTGTSAAARPTTTTAPVAHPTTEILTVPAATPEVPDILTAPVTTETAGEVETTATPPADADEPTSPTP